MVQLAEVVDSFETTGGTYTKERTESGSVRYRKNGQFTSQQAWAGAQSTNPSTGAKNFVPGNEFVPGKRQDLTTGQAITNRYQGFKARYLQNNPDASEDEILDAWRDFEDAIDSVESFEDANRVRRLYGLPAS